MDGINLKKIISSNELQNKISEFARLINEKFKNEEVVIIGVMNGAFYFMHDIMKQIKVDFSYDTLSCSSY